MAPANGELDLEVNVMSPDRLTVLGSLDSGVVAVQRAVVINTGSRPQSYFGWTVIDHDHASYPELSESKLAHFKGRVGFPGGSQEVARGEDHFDAIVYRASGRTQPEDVPILRSLNVGDENSASSRVNLPEHYVRCIP